MVCYQPLLCGPYGSRELSALLTSPQGFQEQLRWVRTCSHEALPVVSRQQNYTLCPSESQHPGPAFGFSCLLHKWTNRFHGARGQWSPSMLSRQEEFKADLSGHHPSQGTEMNLYMLAVM